MDKNEMYELIIIGGGPAGLTSGLYASRAGLRVLLMEGLIPGGQLTTTALIENYPGFPEGIGGFDLTRRFRNQAVKFGLEVVSGEARGIGHGSIGEFKVWKISTDEEKYTALSVIVATGGKPRSLNVPGEERLRGKGVSYCATCDAPLFKDKEIVVVGGGNVAVEESLFLSDFTKKVTLIHRRDRLRATRILQERALSNKKMNFMWNSVVTEILGKERVEGVKVKDLNTQNETIIPGQGIFVFIGFVPNTDFLKGIAEMDEGGYIVTDEDMRTSAPGIFACGDCRRKMLRQVITACGDGATAAFSVQQYVEELKK